MEIKKFCLNVNYSSTCICLLAGIYSFRSIYLLQPNLRWGLLSLLLIWILVYKLSKLVMVPPSWSIILPFYYGWNIVVFIFGYCYMWGHVVWFKGDPRAINLLENHNIKITAVVLSGFQTDPGMNNPGNLADWSNVAVKSMNFKADLKVLSAFCGSCSYEDQLKIPSLLNGHKIRVSLDRLKDPMQSGEIWDLVVRLKKPRNFKTPGSMDLEKYYFSQRIKAVGRIVMDPANKLILAQSSGSYIKLREYLKNLLKQRLEHLQLTRTGILLALLLGETGSLSKIERKYFQDTGVAHLLAISGLHLGFISSGLFVISSYLWKKIIFSTWLMQLIAPVIGSLVSLIGILLYAWLIGANIPILRALIMSAGCYIGIVFGRSNHATDYYYISMIILLLIDPFHSLNLGFWLSYGAVGILLFAGKQITPRNFIKPSIYHYISHTLKVNWLMFIGLIPINASFFHNISVIAYFANIVAIPIMNLLIFPWALLGSIIMLTECSYGKYLLKFADYNLEVLLNILQWLAQFDLANFTMRNINIFTQSLLVLGSIAIWFAGSFIDKLLAIVLFLPAFFIPKEHLAYGDAIVSVLDVGQGLAVVIKLANHNILYDAGPNNKVLANYLSINNLKQFTKVIISHTDQDHIGGLWGLDPKIQVKDFITNIPELPNVPWLIKECQLEPAWILDGVKFEFMMDPLTVTSGNSKRPNRNANSCVLKMTGLGYSMLYTGDLDLPTERKLIQKYGDHLRSTILIVPHHGSNGSSSVEFISTVNPQYAIVSAGFVNRYHHPHPNTLLRYAHKSIKIFNTIEQGTIDLRFHADLVDGSKGSVSINSYQELPLQFWNY